MSIRLLARSPVTRYRMRRAVSTQVVRPAGCPWGLAGSPGCQPGRWSPAIRPRAYADKLAWLTIRWSLTGAPEGVEDALRGYVETTSHGRYSGRKDLRFKTWRMREGQWFEGCYVFETRCPRNVRAGIQSGRRRVTEFPDYRLRPRVDRALRDHRRRGRGIGLHRLRFVRMIARLDEWRLDVVSFGVGDENRSRDTSIDRSHGSSFLAVSEEWAPRGFTSWANEANQTRVAHCILPCPTG